MLKVLLVATVQSHICQFHRTLVDMLRRHGGVQIHVAARDNLSEKNGLQLNFADHVFDIPFSRSPSDPGNLRAYRQLHRVIRDGNYDIIHCNTPVGGVLARIASGSVRRSGTRLIYTAHGFHFYRGASRKNWALYYPVEKVLSRRTDVLITINDEDYRLAAERFCCQVEHIHGVGVDPDRFHPLLPDQVDDAKRAMGFEPQNRLILCVGELLPNKNQIMAIRAMQHIVHKFPETILLIAGNGPQKDILSEEIERLGLNGHVRLLGYCTTLEKYQRICDLSVACSRREGLGLNLIEAMLSGTPVVATSNRGHNELVREGENGLIVEQNNPEALAQAVCRLLSDDALLSRMSRVCPASVNAYTASSVSAELASIYFGR